MKARLLHVIPTLDRSGSEKQLALLVRGLPSEEFEVHVCGLTRGGPVAKELRRAGIPTVVIGKRGRFDVLSFWRLKRHVARLRPDVIHTWLFAANAYGRAAGIACGLKHLVAAERCVDQWKQAAELAVDRYLARYTARIVAVSPGVREFYIQQGLPAEKIEVICNGVPRAEPSDLTRPQLLEQLGLPPEARLVAVIGRLWAQKRVKDAIWAADLLKRIRDDVHLLIVGDGPHRARLRKFRDQVEIRDKVHFLGHREDVGRIVPHLDVLWSTSAYEGQSNSIMEAMAAGVPVVATDIPGTRDLVEHGKTGFLVPAGKRSRAALTKYTNQLLDDAELARRLGAAGRQRMREGFSVQKMVAAYAEMYRRLMGQGPGRLSAAPAS